MSIIRIPEARSAAKDRLRVALISLTIVLLIPVAGIAQTKSISTDSRFPDSALPPKLSSAATANGRLGDADLYRLFPRYDPNSSVRKSNPTPKGYLRLPADSVSGFGIWLRDYPMRGESEPLTTYTGSFIADPTVIGGVLDMPTTSPGYDARGVLYPLMHEYAQVMRRELELNYRGRADDSVLFLRYLTGKYTTNSDRTKYFWKEGKEKPLDESLVKRFTEFVRIITSYRSLIRDCQEISAADVRPGDLFIQTDSTARPDAHLAIALDVAALDPRVDQNDIATSLKDRNGVPFQRIVLYANSLTPATSFHIIKPIKPGKGNWIVPGELESKLKHIGPGRFYRLLYRFLR